MTLQVEAVGSKVIQEIVRAEEGEAGNEAKLYLHSAFINFNKGKIEL